MRAKQIQQVLKPLQQSSSQVFLGQGIHTLGLLGWILEQTGAAHIAVTTFSTSDAFHRQNSFDAALRLPSISWQR